MRKWIKRITIVLLTLVVLVLVLWVGLYYHGRSKLNAELALWRERGVEFQTEFRLEGWFSVGEDERITRLKRLIGELPDDVQDALVDPERASAEELEQAVDAAGDIYELVHEIAGDTLPGTVWETGIHPNMIEELLPRVGGARLIARLLAAEATVRAEQGDLKSAERAIAYGFDIAGVSGRGNLLICLLVEESITFMMIDQIEQQFNQGGTPTHLYSYLQAINLKDRLPEVMEAETRYGMIVMESISSPWLNYDWAYTLGLYRGVIESAERSETPLRELTIAKDHPWWAQLARLTASSWGGTFDSMLRIQTRVEQAKAAILLRQYKAEHGTYPAGLGELVDLPNDPYTGGPFDYRREGDGFVLTSAGDNDGDPIDWHWEK